MSIKRIGILAFFSYFLPSICYLPVYAVNLKDEYAFGLLPDIGTGFSFLVRPGFAVATTAVTIYFVYGAFKLIKSAGDKEEAAGARNMITHAVVGFILLIMMFLLLQFIPELFGLGGLNIIGK